MPEIVSRTDRQGRKRLLFAAFGTLIVLTVVFCGWAYKAKNQRDLNMQLLGAVRKGDAEKARQLLAQGADPNIRDVPQQHLSLWQQIRIAFYRDSPPPDDQKKTLLEMALGLDSVSQQNDESPPDVENVPLVKALLDAGARTEDCSDKHCTPLMTAVHFDHLKTVQMLLDHNANPFARDDNGHYPIHFMRSMTDTEIKIADLLLKHGNDVNAVDNQGWTPLIDCFADDDCDLPMLRFLIAHGANVNARAKDGNGTLVMAIGLSPEATRTLLEHGAEVDPINEDGDTPLTLCLKGDSQADTVKTLIAHGADVNHRNKAGETPLSLARKNDYTQIIMLLEAAGAK